MFDFFKKKPKDDEQPDQVPAAKEAPPTRESWLTKLKNGLSRTREKVAEKIQAIAAARRGIDEAFYDEIVEVLVETDMGMEPAEDLVKLLRREVWVVRSSTPQYHGLPVRPFACPSPARLQAEG
jgi:signal recognition particle GTPase